MRDNRRKRLITKIFNKLKYKFFLLIKGFRIKFKFFIVLIILFVQSELYVAIFLEVDYGYINYRGNKIKKEKLIEDYLSRIFDNNKNINRERRRLYHFLYLHKYPKDLRAQKYYKKIFLKKFSKIKNKPIKKLKLFS